MSVSLYAGALSTGTVDSATTTTVTFTGAAWTADEWIGEVVRIDSGDRQNDSRIITDNSTDTVTFAPALTAAASSGATFRIARAVRPSAGDFQGEFERVGDEHTAFDGTFRSTVRNRPGRFKGRTVPLLLADASSVAGTLQSSTQPVECGGDLLNLTALIECDTDVTSDRFVETGSGPRRVLEFMLKESS